jgi:hypothetical protein
VEIISRVAGYPVVCGSVAQEGRDAGADRFDGSHELRMRQRRRVHLKTDAGDAAQRFTVSNDLLDHLFDAVGLSRSPG